MHRLVYSCTVLLGGQVNSTVCTADHPFCHLYPPVHMGASTSRERVHSFPEKSFMNAGFHHAMSCGREMLQLALTAAHPFCLHTEGLLSCPGRGSKRACARALTALHSTHRHCSAACPFLPLPCCPRPKTILAFPAASGL